MTKPMQSLWMLGALGLALSAAPLFAQQSDANAPASSQSTQHQQSPTDPTATAPQTQSPDQTAPGQTAQPPAGQAQPGQPPAGQSGSDAQSQSAGDSQSFSGTVVKSGDKFVLQDASGKTYDIDHQDEVKKYEGKQVRVKGTLDPDGKTIHLK